MGRWVYGDNSWHLQVNCSSSFAFYLFNYLSDSSFCGCFGCTFTVLSLFILLLVLQHFSMFFVSLQCSDSYILFFQQVSITQLIETDLCDSSLLIVSSMLVQCNSPSPIFAQACKDFRACKWPDGLINGDNSLAAHFDAMNDKNQDTLQEMLARCNQIISFSHFVPRLVSTSGYFKISLGC